MAGLVERKKKDIRGRIISAAGELFIRQGFANTTMDQIAAEAVVARKTLYNYFPLKEAIADAYVRSISEESAGGMLEAIERLPDLRARLIAAINSRYDWLEFNPELSRTVMMYRMKSSLRKDRRQAVPSGSREFIMNILRASRERGEINPELSLERILGFIEYQRTAIVLEWLDDSAGMNLREETVRLVDLVLYGALGPPRKNERSPSDEES